MVVQEKLKHLRKGVILCYVVVWIITLIFNSQQYLKYKSNRKVYQEKVEQMQTKLEQIIPKFDRVMRQYHERNRYKEELVRNIGPAVSPEFVLESLEKLSLHIFDNAWLDELKFSVFDPGLTDDDEPESDAVNMNFLMVLKGNMFLDFDDQNSDKLQNLIDTINATNPFSLAKSQLDLSNMKVNKLNEKYYHNFSIEYFWSDIIL